MNFKSNLSIICIQFSNEKYKEEREEKVRTTIQMVHLKEIKRGIQQLQASLGYEEQTEALQAPYMSVPFRNKAKF